MNTLKFLGTSGARFVVIQQLRNSGGLWLNIDGTNILIDPGPGSLVRCLASRPKLNPRILDGIILTHRHLDHANDVNIMIEAMTNGGSDKKGSLFAPSDAFEIDPIILHYIRNNVKKIQTLREKRTYAIGNISFETPIRHVHDVETYGLNFIGENCSLSLISDTQYFEGIEEFYPGDILILNVVLFKEIPQIKHLSYPDVKKILEKRKPKLCILTHFGMTMIKNKPWVLAENLSKKYELPVIAARDGLTVDLNKYH
ncbi:MAG: MBL fold metallo-hydrolase [Thermoplasmatota archaeon]